MSSPSKHCGSNMCVPYHQYLQTDRSFTNQTPASQLLYGCLTKLPPLPLYLCGCMYVCVWIRKKNVHNTTTDQVNILLLFPVELNYLTIFLVYLCVGVCVCISISILLPSASCVCRCRARFTRGPQYPENRANLFPHLPCLLLLYQERICVLGIPLYI